MKSLQQWKQLELYSQYPSQTASRDTSSEEFIASGILQSFTPLSPLDQETPSGGYLKTRASSSLGRIAELVLGNSSKGECPVTMR